MQNDYTIEKNRVPVVLHTVAGERITGDVFVQPYVPHRRGPEQVIDLLNSDEPFVPVRCSDGAIRFLRIDRLSEAELVDGVDNDRHTGAREACVELTLDSGDCYTARVFYEVPNARPRLLDWLNRIEQRFVLVHASTGPRLVNWRSVATVRPLD